MKLIRMNVNNLFGVEECSLEFPEKGVVSIQGPNGAGKSSLLDSVAVALFGEPSPSRDVKNPDILRAGMKEGGVFLEFEISGTTYSVERTFSRSKKGAVSHKAILRVGGGSPEGLATGPDAVNEKISSLLLPNVKDRVGAELAKMARTVWFSSVFLPQGKMTRILEMKASERREVVVSLFGLDDADRLKERAKELLDAANRETRDLENDERRLGELLEEISSEEVGSKSVAEAESELSEARETEKRLETSAKDTAEIARIADVLLESRLKVVSLGEKIEEAKRRERVSNAVLSLERCRESANLFLERKAEAMGLEQTRDTLKERLVSAEKDVADFEKALEDAKKDEDASKKMAASAPLVRNIVALRTRLLDLKKRAADLESEIKEKRAESKRLLFEGAGGRLFNALEELESSKKREMSRKEDSSLALGGLRNALVEWLRILGGGETVDVSEVASMDAEIFGKILEKSGVSGVMKKASETSALAALASKETAEILERTNALKRDFDMLGGAEKTPERRDSPDELVEKAGELAERARDAETELVQIRERIEETKRLGIEQKAALAGVNEEKCLEAEKELPSLSALTERRSQLLSESVRFRDRVALDLSNAESALPLALDRFRRATEARDAAGSEYRKIVAGWTAERFDELGREMKSPERFRVQEGEVLRLEGVLSEVSRVVFESEKRLALEGVSPNEAKSKKTSVENAFSEARSKVVSVAAELERIKSREKNKRELLARKSRVHAARMSLAGPAGDAKLLSKLSEGSSLGTFLQDKATEALLAYVNSGLASSERWSGYSFSSNGGVIMVDDGTGKRVAGSLSGGEAVAASLLFARGMRTAAGMDGILAVDEGFSQLDTDALEQTAGMLSALGTDSLVLAVTHDPEFAREFEVWTVSKGGKVEKDADAGERVFEAAV